jgi:PST family polysaccharide transporter
VNDRAALANAAGWAAIWAFLGTIAGRLITVIGLAFLARLLAPKDFGLFTFALVFITYLETFGDLGSGVALVYWPNRLRDAAQVTFVINVLMGLAWFAVATYMAPAVANFFGSPNADGMVRALAWTFILKGLSNTHDALAQKEMRFRAKLLPDCGFAVLKMISAIVLARAGFGGWALVWGHLIGLASSTIFYWLIVPWRPSFYFPSDLLRPMLRYGRGIVIVNLLGAIVHRADMAIVGRMLGVTALGFYQLGDRMSDMTVTVLLWVISKVVFPIFARVHALGHGLAEAYLTAMRYISLTTIPATIGLFMMAEPLVVTVFGEVWRPSIPIVQALAVYAGFRALGTHSGDVLKATGRSGVLARLAVLKIVLIVPALILAARFNMMAVAITLAALTSLTGFLNIWIVCRLAKIPLIDVFRAMRLSLIGGAVLALALLAWNRFTDLRAGASLAGGAAIGTAAYLIAVRLFSPRVYREIFDSLSRRRLVGAEAQ